MVTHSQGAQATDTSHYFTQRKKLCHVDKVKKLHSLSVSAISIGTYLGNPDDVTDEAYEQSLEWALLHGCNFIDTAINYRCQRSEKNIGRVLHKLIQQKKIKRAEVVIATKGGFLPFQDYPPKNLQEYIQKTWLDTGLVLPQELVASCHCLSPDFIRNQIDQSLENLHLKTIDLYYLHNPEMQLSALGEDEFYKKLKSVFEVLEEYVKLGKIQYYGLATWKAFREPKGSSEYIDLNRVLNVCESVSEDHHFQAIQLPYSMAMLEAISLHNQMYHSKSYPIISAAGMLGVNVMISAPLLQSQLLHLPPSIANALPGDINLVQKALQFVSSTPSVTSAIVGMKQIEHAKDNFNTLQQQNWSLETLERVCDILAGS